MKQKDVLRVLARFRDLKQAEFGSIHVEEGRKAQDWGKVITTYTDTKMRTADSTRETM